jgi:hypothetical protein
MLSHAVLRAVVRTLLGVVLLTFPGRLCAYYEESHITADDVRVVVAPGGAARVEHSLSWRLVAGQPKSFDLVGSEPSAEPESSSVLEADDGHRVPVAVLALPGRGLRVSVLEPKQLRHGHTYKVRVAYSLNLSTAGELTRDGAYYHLQWKGLAHGEGCDGATATFVLPASVEPPTAIIAAATGEAGMMGGMIDDGVAAILKRAADHDELQMVRPHVGRGEQVVWALRIPARSLDGATTPALPPAPPPPRHDAPRDPGPFVYGVLVIIAAAFASASRLAAQPRRAGLVPLPPWERAALGAATLFAGMCLQLSGERVLGATCLVLAMGSSVLAPAREGASARGPGQWLVLRPEDAFRIDAPAGRGSTLLVLAIMLSLGGFLTASLLVSGRPGVQPEAALVLPIDALVLLPLVASLPERDGSLAWLRAAFTHLKGIRHVKCSPWGRVPLGRHDPDELRIFVMPKDTLPGFSALEVGIGGAGPEVLVRASEDSAAAAKLSTLSLSLSTTPGRTAEERVYRFFPDDPTVPGTLALVLRLSRQLEDRRTSADARPAPDWLGQDRRVPRGPDCQIA